MEKKSQRAPFLHDNEHKISDYENLVVAHYLNELRKSPPYTKRSHREPISPYAQKLAHTHVVLTAPRVHGLASRPPTSGGHHRPTRPQSALMYKDVKRLPEERKPKIDPKFIADPDKWDPATPRPTDLKKSRPVSAPIGPGAGPRRPVSAYGYSSYQRNRPSSAKSNSSTGSRYGTRRSKKLFKKQPYTIVVTAYRNGSRQKCCKVAAPNIKLLLEMCTDKLNLPGAGRRIFSSAGHEIFDGESIERGSEIYISLGEDYKDPNAGSNLNASQKKKITWGMNGLVIPTDARKKATRPSLSKRFKECIENKTLRLIIFRNGKCTDPVEVVCNPKNWIMAVDKMSARLDMCSPVRVLFDWSGQPVITVTQKWDGSDMVNVDKLPLVDSLLYPQNSGLLYGPLWASFGEGFNPVGVHGYMSDSLTQLKARIAYEKNYVKQMEIAEDGCDYDVTIVAILSMTTNERTEAIESMTANIEAMKSLKKELKERIATMDPSVDEREVVQNSYKHIKELSFSDRLVGVRGINLTVYRNGTIEAPYKIFFNLTDASKRSDTKEEIMMRLLEHISTNCHRLRAEGQTRGLVSRKWRLYDVTGREIRDVHELTGATDEEDESERSVWLSFGEAYKLPFSLCLQATFERITAMSVSRSTQPTPKPPAPPKKTKKSKKQKGPKMPSSLPEVVGFDYGSDIDTSESEDSSSSSSDSSSDDESEADDDLRPDTPILLEEKVVCLKEPLNFEGNER